MQTELFNDDCGKGTKRWGMPWMGSKSDIAWQVVNAIPKGETFVDLFFGGGAITHAAIVSKRWDNFIANDILGTPDIFIKAVRGELKGYDRFVSRSEFKASDDIVVKMLWSFGNDLKSYLWSPKNERIKGIATQMLTAKTLESRRMYFKNFIGALKKEDIQNIDRLEWIERLERFQSLQGLERLELLQSLQGLDRLERLQHLQGLERIERLQGLKCDYRAVTIPRGGVVYCDIPYKGTSGYIGGFDHEAFYEWFSSLKVPAFCSEYDAPFTMVAEWDKLKKKGDRRKMNVEKIKERLYFNGTMDEYMELMNP